MLLIIMGSISVLAYAETAIKCWKNSDNIRECGKKIPPEYSQKSHEKINSRGITIDKSERAKTKEERVKERLIAAQQEEEKARKLARDIQNKILLETYNNVDDIKLSLGEKIATLASSIRLANRQNEKIQINLDKKIAIVAKLELAGKEPKEILFKDIELLQKQINNNLNFIERKELEQDTIKKEYAEKITRFKQLTELKSR